MATGDETTILLRDSDMEVEIKEGRDSGVLLSFISQDGSRFSVDLSDRDAEAVGRLLLDSEEQGEDEEAGDVES